MTMNNPGKTLIDKAAKMCGSQAALARKLGTSPQALSQMKHGEREISPETAALLADIAKEDPQQAVIAAVIERNRTGPKAEQIREILGKALAAGGAAMLLFYFTEPSISAMGIVAAELTMMHIVLSRAAQVARGTCPNIA